jgi:hypothetical protein
VSKILVWRSVYAFKAELAYCASVSDFKHRSWALFNATKSKAFHCSSKHFTTVMNCESRRPSSPRETPIPASARDCDPNYPIGKDCC